MILNPQKIVDLGIITDLNNDKLHISTNGVDLTLSKVFKVLEHGQLYKNTKYIPEYREIETRTIYSYQTLKYQPNVFEFEYSKVYSLLFNQYIKLPENIAALIIHRSTILRMGAQIISGLYDSGFENQLGAFLFSSNRIKIEKDTRVAQIIFFEADSAELYDGSYSLNKVLHNYKQFYETKTVTKNN